MRRLSKDRQMWLDRRARLLCYRCIKAARARRHGVRGANSPKLRSFIVTVPKLLIGEKHEQRVQILMTIMQIERQLQLGGYRIKLDFSRVQKIFPGGMLILLAALQRLSSQYPGRISARCPPQSLSSQLLNHFGLAGVLGVSHGLSKPTAASVLSWSYLTGTQAAGAEIKELLDKYRNNTNAEIPPSLFAVLTEGLINVRHHAYQAMSDLPETLRRWWLFARYDEPKDEQKGSLYIAIYDMGAGIPATMRNKLEKKEVVIDLLDKAAEFISMGDGDALDKRLLYEAVEHKRSQTGQPHRGNGLPEMREFIETTEGGRLHIVSGKAQYSFVPGKSEGYTDGFRQPFPGTLLLWGLPLKAKEIST